ncbi:PilW family protein [Lysobacter claricitrinus]|uniref:PilW family protein n=1 Tax=Lysobacter claricitrinus TaxID=3367728 RepID=UPI0037DAF4F9
MTNFLIHQGAARRQRGVSLIELMIALVLGVLVVAGAGAVFLSNKRTFGASETLNRIQENERASFEIMSRDVREAGGNPCSTSAKPVNMLNASGNAWWSSYTDGIHGYAGTDTTTGTSTGTTSTSRVAGTEAIDLALANEGGDVRVTSHNDSSAPLQVSSATGFAAGQILMVCDMDVRIIFKATGITGSSIAHTASAGIAENCNARFAIFDALGNCATVPSPGAPSYCFAVSGTPGSCSDFGNSPARVTRVTLARWYIGNNARGGTSLYRAVVMNNTGTTTPNTPTPTEIAEGATAMTITYLRRGQATFEAPAAITAANAWGQVIAARVSVTFGGVTGAVTGDYLRETNANGTTGAAISNTMTNVVTLRNREGLM